MNEQELTALINRRRRQMLVHSCIYYRFNDSVIDDHTFDKWARELAVLQQQHPLIAEKCVYNEVFRGFDGSTGFHLPLSDPWVVDMAIRLLRQIGG